MKNFIIAAVLAISTITVMPTHARGLEGFFFPARCVEPTVYDPVDGTASYPAYVVSMKTITGAHWAAYIDNQFSAFEWTPGTFLYSALYDGDRPNQQELVDVLDECAARAGVPCRLLGIDQISPNPSN